MTPPAEYKHHVQINQPHGHALVHHAEQHENVGDHDRREQFEKILHPQMHDPEPPEIRRGESGVRPHEQPDGVKGGNGQRGKEEQPRHVARVFGPQFVPQTAEQDHDPEEQTHRQQNLPEPAEIEKRETLMAEPRPAVLNPAEDARIFAAHAAEHDDRQRAEQQIGKHALAARFAAGDHRHEKNARRQIRRGDPENRQLQMPGAGDVERQHARQIEAEKVGKFRAIMFPGAAQKRLHQKQQRHDEEEPGARALRRRQHHFIRRTERNALLLAPVPAEKIPPAKGGQQQTNAAEQRDQRKHAPKHGVRRGMIADERFGRPVVRVGIIFVRSQGGTRPGRPTEKGRELPDLFRVGDGIGPQADISSWAFRKNPRSRRSFFGRRRPAPR